MFDITDQKKSLLCIEGSSGINSNGKGASNTITELSSYFSEK